MTCPKSTQQVSDTETGISLGPRTSVLPAAASVHRQKIASPPSSLTPHCYFRVTSAVLIMVLISEKTHYGAVSGFHFSCCLERCFTGLSVL